MKFFKQKSAHRITPLKPDRPSLIYRYCWVLRGILLLAAVVIILSMIVSNQAKFIFSIFALGCLVVIAITQWLMDKQVNIGMGTIQQFEHLFLSRGMELNESENKFGAFIEESSEGMVLTDEQGIVIEWNRSMERLTGIESINALGKHIWELQELMTVPERRSEQATVVNKNFIMQALTTGISPQTRKPMVVEISTSNGQRITVEQASFTIKSEKGYWIGSIFNDISERMQAENAQKESLLRLNALLNNIPDIAWLIDENNKFIAVNKPIVDFFNSTPEDLVGKTYADLYPVELARQFQADDQEVMQTKQQKRVDGIFFNKDGNERWVETIKTPIINEQGEVMGIAGIGRDITERKNYERMQTAIYQISEAAQTVSSLDELYRKIHTSIRGLMPAKNFYIALNDTSADLIHFVYHTDELEPDVDWPPIKPGKGLTNYVFNTGEPLLATPEIFDHLIQTGDTELIGKKAVDWLGVPLVTQHGKIGVMAVQTYNLKERLSETDKDILMFVSTQIAMAIERRQMEDDLRTSQANLEAAQRIAHVGSWDWDLLTGKITFSKELFTILGVEPGVKLSPGLFIELVHPDDRARVEASIQKAISENLLNDDVHRIITPVGVECIVHDQSEIIFNEISQPVRRVGTLQDITFVRRAEAEREKLILELQTKNAELDRFTYTVSHDLRAPLVTIRGFLGFMEKDLKAGNAERLTKDMVRITTAANKMQQFLDELLQLSRAGRILNPPEPVPFREIAVDIIELLRGRIEARGVQVDIAENLPTILCDRNRMTQVVQNLVDNAVKFLGNQPNPRIEIGTEGKNAEGKAVLYVRDNGIGIESQYQDIVFNIFNKLDAQTEGTGIGLALVKRVIEAHNGRVWLKSEGTGTGATFYFSCPLSVENK